MGRGELYQQLMSSSLAFSSAISLFLSHSLVFSASSLSARLSMMAQSLKLTIGIVVLLHACGGKAAILAPAQDIVLPPSSSASNPLEWLGANSPWFAGPDVNGVDNSVPDDCTVEQAAYVSRHGSRYPDTGAYAQWTALYDKVGFPVAELTIGLD